MDRKKKREMTLHHAVSAIGGFLGCYAIFNHNDVFGNAQTANLIHIVCKIFSADFSGILFLVAGLAAFMAGNIFYVLATRHLKADIRAISLIMTICAVIFMGMFPHVINPYIAVLPILFVTPVQWNAFGTAGGYASATAFSSNNVRQATTSLVSYIMDKDKKMLEKTRFYWMTLLCFHAGAALSCVTSVFCSTYSIWFCFIPILLSVAAYVRLEGFKIRRVLGIPAKAGK